MERGTSAEAEASSAVGLGRPRSLTLALTGRCNLRCAHCLVESGPDAGAGHVRTQAVLRVVRELASLGGEELVLTGGEPLVHPDWVEILACCCGQRAFRAVTVQTNGALLDAGRVAALRALAFEGLSLEVSVDGSSPATHDRVRGRGSFARTLGGLRLLAAAGLGRHVSVAFTEMRHNLDELPALVELVASLGLRRLVSGTLVARGRAGGGELEPPTPAQYGALVSRWHADARFRERCEALANVAAIEWWKGRHGRGADCCAFERPYVAADGAMYPCALLRDEGAAVRGVFERPLEAALREARPRWSRLLALERRRHGALPACERCPGRAHCGGGCMGRAHAASGDFLAVEDRCALRMAVYRWKPNRGDPCRSAPWNR